VNLEMILDVASKGRRRATSSSLLINIWGTWILVH